MNRAMLLAASMLVTACGGGGGYDGGSSGMSAGLTYTIGGMVSGLTGTVVLQNNSGDNLSVSANGSFTFRSPISYANGYDVSVLTQPMGQTCTVTNGAGAYPGMSVTSVTVTCR